MCRVAPLLVLAAQPALASSFPDLELIFWGYPLLVSSLSALLAWLVRGRRTSPILALAVILLASVLGNASVVACMNIAGDFGGALFLWTSLVATCSWVGISFCPLRAAAR